MPVTRTPIIDDDGSGHTGTIIDNAWKQELYNQIDLGLFDQHIATNWADVPYSAANFSANAGAWTVEPGDVLAFAYARVGQIAHLSLYLQNTVLSATPGSLTILVPLGVTWARWVTTPVALKLPGSLSEMGILQAAPGTNVLTIYRNFFAGAFPAGTVDLGVLLALPLT